MRTLDDHLFGPGPKRILSLDGGGVRGLVTLGMLLQVERLLRARMPADKQADFRLCHYFDLIGGTSTGALIAALLALGCDVESIIGIYTDLAPKVFNRPLILPVIKPKFDSNALEAVIKQTLAEVRKRAGHDPSHDIKLSSSLLKTGLAIFTKRIDTGSVWEFTNNRKAKYWDPQSTIWQDHYLKNGKTHFFPNSEYSLAQVVRASASAPFYLDGVTIAIEADKEGHFLDGGVSPFNNPAAQLFLMTTLKSREPHWNKEEVSPYGFNWATGKESILLLSLGTGTWKVKVDAGKFKRSWNIYKAKNALMSMIDDASLNAITWLQALSDPPVPERVNSNLMTMQGLRITREPLLSFRRVCPILDGDWLKALSPELELSPRVLGKTLEMDNSNPDNLARLIKIGTETGKRDITAADFPAAFDLEDMGRMKSTGSPGASTGASGDRLNVGFTGHRWNRLPSEQLLRIIAEIETALGMAEAEAKPEELVLVSGLAEGSDRLAAKAALKRGWSIAAILPFSHQRYLQDFETQASRTEFEDLIARCVFVDEAPAADALPDADDGYAAQGAALVAKSDALITVWDGADAHGHGGTQHVIEKAKAKPIPVVWISTLKAGPSTDV